MALFLTQDEVAELTGIRRGRNGLSRNQLQVEQLRRMGLPFFVNAAGRPLVASAVIEGGVKKQPKQSGWQPAVLNS
jgi:hypothetical protein